MKSDKEDENVITLEERKPRQSHEETPTRDLLAQFRLPQALESIWQALPEAKPEAARKAFGTFDRTDRAIFAYIDLSSRFRDMKAAGGNEDSSLRILIHEYSTDLFVSPNPHEDSPSRPDDELIQQDATMLLCAISDTTCHFDSILYLPPEVRQRGINKMARCYGLPSHRLLEVRAL